MVNNMLVRFLSTILALYIASEIVSGVDIETLYAACIAALILGILNAVVRPILIVLTLPVTILSLGLFIFVLNAGLFWFVASFVDDLEFNRALAGFF